MFFCRKLSKACCYRALITVLRCERNLRPNLFLCLQFSAGALLRLVRRIKGLGPVFSTHGHDVSRTYLLPSAPDNPSAVGNRRHTMDQPGSSAAMPRSWPIQPRRQVGRQRDATRFMQRLLAREHLEGLAFATPRLGAGQARQSAAFKGQPAEETARARPRHVEMGKLDAGIPARSSGEREECPRRTHIPSRPSPVVAFQSRFGVVQPHPEFPCRDESFTEHMGLSLVQIDH